MDTATAEIYTLSLHDALPIFRTATFWPGEGACATPQRLLVGRSEEHTSELQSRFDLVCRLLLEKKNMAVRIGSPANSTQHTQYGLVARKLPRPSPRPSLSSPH